MEKIKFEGKTEEEALQEALQNLNCNREDLYYNAEEIKTGLFKAKKVEISVFTRNDVINLSKDFLKNITKKIGVESNFEVKTRDGMTVITIFCENNNILIGKYGRTINALTVILRQYLQNELGFNFNFILDVGDYKAKNQKRIERLAKSVAREVSKTKVEAKLDPMNSYERRIVHTILGNSKYVTTESIGEEPNRAVVIKPKKQD